MTLEYTPCPEFWRCKRVSMRLRAALSFPAGCSGKGSREEARKEVKAQAGFVQPACGVAQLLEGRLCSRALPVVLPAQVQLQRAEEECGARRRVALPIAPERKAGGGSGVGRARLCSHCPLELRVTLGYEDPSPG